MSVKILVAVTFVQILLVSCQDEITFPISKDLNDAKVLLEKDRAIVTVMGLCSLAENSKVNVKFDIPEHLKKDIKSVNIFFANVDQEILKVELKDKAMGTKYVTPYQESKTFEGDQVQDYKVSFPGSWLPSKITRISAALEFEDKIYCTYGLRNYEISIPDLMVVQEYNKINCNPV